VRQLSSQGTSFAAQDNTSSRSQQDPVRLDHLIGTQHKDASTLVQPGIRTEA
jgi:hypothetical protein